MKDILKNIEKCKITKYLFIDQINVKYYITILIDFIFSQIGKLIQFFQINNNLFQIFKQLSKIQDFLYHHFYIIFHE